MKISIYLSDNQDSFLVTMDATRWQQEIADMGFTNPPLLIRNATTPELIAYYERSQRVPAWIYPDLQELLDDEHYSGASREHLQSLKNLCLAVSDHSPQPQSN